MAVEFAEMPIKDGICGCYDVADYNGDGVWINRFGNLPLLVSNTVYVDNKAVVFPVTNGYGYVADDIGNNFTVYAIVKADTPTTFNGTSWGIAVCGSDYSYRVFAGQNTDDNSWDFYTPYSVGKSVSASEWHVIALSVNNGLQSFYVDGDIVLSSAEIIDYDTKGLYINTGAYNGDAPNGDEICSAQMYLKYIGYAKSNHSAAQIKRNTDWLLVQYGFKDAPADGKMAGADAAAIAWCIAHNLEQEQSLEAQKKAYRQGVSRGGEGVTEPWDTEDSDIEFDVDEDGNGNDPAFIDFDKGVKLMYANPDDPTDTVTVRFWLDHSEDGDVVKNGIYRYTGNGKPTLTLTYSDGTEISDSMGTYHVETNIYGNESNVYPRHIMGYRIEMDDSNVWVHAHIATPNDSFWTYEGNYLHVPIVTVPEGYKYAGAKNYDSTAT